MFWFADLSCVVGDGGGHDSLQIAAETDALHRDDGLLGEHGPAGTSATLHHMHQQHVKSFKLITHSDRAGR